MPRDMLVKYGAIVIFAVVNLLVTFTPVIAPPGGQTAMNANLYKGASLVLGLIVLWLAVRQNRYLLLVGFAMLQLFAFSRFSATLNSGGLG